MLIFTHFACLSNPPPGNYVVFSHVGRQKSRFKVKTEPDYMVFCGAKTTINELARSPVTFKRFLGLAPWFLVFVSSFLMLWSWVPSRTYRSNMLSPSSIVSRSCKAALLLFRAAPVVPVTFLLHNFKNSKNYHEQSSSTCQVRSSLFSCGSLQRFSISRCKYADLL